jgi:hypothetical protein
MKNGSYVAKEATQTWDFLKIINTRLETKDLCTVLSLLIFYPDLCLTENERAFLHILE